MARVPCAGLLIAIDAAEMTLAQLCQWKEGPSIVPEISIMAATYDAAISITLSRHNEAAVACKAMSA